MKRKIIAIATSLSVAVMIAGPVPVQALTAAELQVQIDALLAQLSQLQAQLSTLEDGTTPSGTIPAACTGITFDSNLKQGMSGANIKCLQSLLNTDAATKLADSGPGSPGSETNYFGPITKGGVIKFQEKYAAEVLAPWNLTAGTGFVGSTTRAKLNAILQAGVSPVTPVCGNGVCETGESEATCPADCTGVTPPPPPPPPGTGLTVSLAPDTPATATLVTGQAIAPLAKFRFANGDSAEVKVTKLKLKRLGVSADATLSNVYLFDGAVRLTDSASVSSGIITFSDTGGLFKVAAGTTKTVTVYSDIATGTSGETTGVAVNAASDVTSGASSVKGSFPINGNLMSIASGTLAGIDFNNTTTPSAADVDPQDDYTVWQNIITVTTRAANFNRISLREIGTINYPDLENFRLYVDGVQAGSAVASLDDNGYVTFDLSASPKRLEAGARTIKVMANIIGGSSRTFSFSLRTAADANFSDTQYGVNILPTANSSSFSARTSGEQTVQSGVITVTKMSDSPAGNVINLAPAISLAKYEVKAAGERVKVESLKVAVLVKDTGGTNKGGSTAATQVGYLRNGMLLANGVQVGSTSNLYEDSYSTTYTTFNLGSSLIVEPGSPVSLEVVADIFDNDGTNSIIATDTIQAQIVASTSNAEGLTSKSSINVPATAVNGNQVTVAAGTLTLSKYTAFPNKTYVAPLTATKLAHFTLTGGTTEPVNINTILVNLATVTGAVDGSDDLSNLYVVYGTNTTTVKPTVADGDNSWSVNYQLAAGQTIDIIAYADVASGAYAAGTTDTLTPRARITGVTANSASTVNAPGAATYTSGQVITFGAGAITSAVAGETPLAQVVSGSSAADIVAGTPKQVTAGKFKFTAANDDFTIKEVKVKVGSATISGAILYAVLKDGSTVLGTEPFAVSSNTTAYFTGLSVSVPANTTKTLTVDLILSQPSADTSTSQVDAKVTLDWFKYSNSQGAESTDDNDKAANSMYVYQSVPTFTQVDLANTSTLNNGSSSKIYSFKAAADSKGNVSLKQLKFGLSWSDNGTAGTLELESWKFYRGSTNITGSVTIQNSSAASVESTTGVYETDSVVVVTFDTEETVPAGETRTYSLYATPQAFVYEQASGYDAVGLNLLSDTAHNATDVYLYGTGVAQLAGDNAGTGASDYNIIWSDNSATLHSYTPANAYAYDWADGYLVLNLPLDSESWQVQ